MSNVQSINQLIEAPSQPVVVSAHDGGGWVIEEFSLTARGYREYTDIPGLDADQLEDEGVPDFGIAMEVAVARGRALGAEVHVFDANGRQTECVTP